MRILPVVLTLIAIGCGGGERADDGTHSPGSETGESEPEVPTFELSEEDLAELDEAFATLIAEGQAIIDALEDEIEALEAENAAKAAEIDSLVAQIEAREDELWNQYQQNLVLCTLFPDPRVCVFAVYLDNDTKMNNLKAELSAARARQAEIHADIEAYEAERDELRAELEPIRDARERLIAMYEGDVPLVEVPEVLGGGTVEAETYQQSETLRILSTATQEEIALLVELRNSAGQLAQSLDVALADVQAVATRVDKLVDDSREVFMELLKGVLSENAGAVAEDFLDEALAAKTRQLLDELDWPAREFVRHLLETAPGESVDLDALANDLLEHLLADTSTSWANAVPLSIVSETTTKSFIDVSVDNQPGVAHISIDGAHDEASDLTVSVVGPDGSRWVVRSGIGAGAEDIADTYVVPLPASYDPIGTWTLELRDDAKGGDGDLEGWILVLD